MDQDLKRQQIKVMVHKKYLFKFLYDSRILLTAILLPALIWGWKQAPKQRVGQLTKQALKFGLVSAVSAFRHRILIK